ncbi:MAG: cytochrome b N-terminal domain-containing protein [Planctomyces sp.]|nr:cytochrome b N-terminal domain-containing protein [Planctomyces sp.]
MNSARDWIVDRFALRPIYDRLLDRRVPRSPWYAGDGAALMLLLGVQILTGAALSLTYSPAADSAYASVEHITEAQVLGWFVRGLHYWSAGLMVVMLFYHLFRQILLAGYKAPREGTWLIGVLLFFAVLLMSYTGYLLRWDERAVHGVRVTLHMLSRVPMVGESLTLIAQRGPELGPQTLSQLYGLHVVILPLLIVGLTGYHLYLIVQRGTITRAERHQPVETAEHQRELYRTEKTSVRGGEHFFPETAFKSGLMATLVLTAAIALTMFVGAPRLFPEGNLVESSLPAEEWWFWWFSGLIALLPPSIAPWFVVLVPIVAFTVLILLPFVDRGPSRGVKHRPGWAFGVILLIVALLALTDYRRRSPFTGWPDPAPPPIPIGVELTEAAERGRVAFADLGCNSCHPVSGRGRTVGPDLARLTPPRSRLQIEQYVLQPPVEAAMPAYAGRISEEDLSDVVEFCHVAQTFPRRL